MTAKFDATYTVIAFTNELARMAKRCFIEKLRAAAASSKDDDNLFAEIIRETNLEDSELASMFMVSGPTVNRWRNGLATPHQAIKRRIYEVLAERTNEALQTARRD